MKKLKIALIAGDGIGPEILGSCLRVLDVINQNFKSYRLIYETVDAGANYFNKTGRDINEEAFNSIGSFDGILMGAIGLPSVRYPDGTEIAPHLRIRKKLELYSGIRPVKAYPNVPSALADPRAKGIDLIIVRESTEGLFASIGNSIIEGDTVAKETLEITRDVCERLFDSAFTLARKRKNNGGKGLVTCVDKANVFPAMAFFRKIFMEKAKENKDISVNYCYVDAAALQLVKNPWNFDVIVTENMFGDILSDLGAGIIGGMGFAPCAEIGDNHGLFQPAHGSAPDIAGKNMANPTAMLISAAMMLEWLGEKNGISDCFLASENLINAVHGVFNNNEISTSDMGGSDSNTFVTEKIMQKILI